MKRPISSRVRMMLAYSLIEAGLVEPTEGIDRATILIERLRDRGFDLVHKDWVDGAVTTDSGTFSWDDIATMADKIEHDFGRKPWVP